MSARTIEPQFTDCLTPVAAFSTIHVAAWPTCSEHWYFLCDKYKNNIKLKDEVGMAGSKST